MERKAKIGQSPLMIIGIVYTVLGSIFTALGITLAVLLWDGQERMIGLVFGGVGSIFLILGIFFLAQQIRRKKQADKLLASGRYIWGEVVDMVANVNVSINGRHPYMIMVQYTDAYGVRHIFKSPNLRIYRDSGLLGRKVKVYISDETYKQYYVDVEGILPDVMEH